MDTKTVFTWMIVFIITLNACVPTQPPEEPAAKIDGDLQQILAYTLPASGELSSWTIPIKVAPFFKIAEYQQTFPDWWTDEGNPTPSEVGVLEIGSGSDKQGQYLVAIDLVSENEVVPGFIASTENQNIHKVLFQRIPQIVNPARGERASFEEFKILGTPPDIAVAISANSVCFVVNITQVENGEPKYIRYCSQSDSVLSVRVNFPSQYEAVQSQVLEVAGQLGFTQKDLQIDQIISEMEDTSHLNDCREQILNPSKPTSSPEALIPEAPVNLKFSPPEAPAIPTEDKPSLEFSQNQNLIAENLASIREECRSDITVAPVTLDYFRSRHESMQIPTGKQVQVASLLTSIPKQEVSQVPVAVVLIHQPIDTSLGIVYPGEYQMYYWYDDAGELYAATITGMLTEDGSPVTDQRVPAVPATFINEDETEQPGAQISACRIFGICVFFQKTCS